MILRVSHSHFALRKGDGEAFGRLATERLTMLITKPIDVSYCAFGIRVILTVFVKPDKDPKVSSTAEASYPQCTMQSAHFSLRPVP